ncbi:hypothetical protein ACI2LC_10090 [Nonomuraea wenchangensis]|uniref:hypothetical protein n=1 Tax=Nonomuraea wenchangensis TaxID=568860 RepID=UPI003326056F
MTDVEIAFGAVEREAARVRAHGEDYGAVLTPMHARGDGVSSWGDDGLFSVFTSFYTECRETSMAALGGLHAMLVRTGDGLHDTARNSRDAETANTEVAGDVGATWV